MLETASIKLASVASDVFGTSGLAMLRALATGETDATRLAQLARSSLRGKIPALIEALEGNFEPHHRILLSLELERLDEVTRSLRTLDGIIDAKLVPYQPKLELLKKIPGFDRVVAASFIAETGGDMSVFPTAGHLAAWAGVAPGNHQTGGKSRSVGVRRGNVHLTTSLFQATMGAVRQRGSYYKDKYWRLLARRGPKRARLAIAHKLLIAAYEVLKHHKPFADLGDRYLDSRSKTDTARRLVARLKTIGFDATLTPREVT